MPIAPTRADKDRERAPSADVFVTEKFARRQARRRRPVDLNLRLKYPECDLRIFAGTLAAADLPDVTHFRAIPLASGQSKPVAKLHKEMQAKMLP
jgi:hypothetical protein